MSWISCAAKSNSDIGFGSGAGLENLLFCGPVVAQDHS